MKEMERMNIEKQKRDHERDSAMEKRRLLEQRMEQIYLLGIYCFYFHFNFTIELFYYF